MTKSEKIIKESASEMRKAEEWGAALHQANKREYAKHEAIIIVISIIAWFTAICFILYKSS